MKLVGVGELEIWKSLETEGRFGSDRGRRQRGGVFQVLLFISNFTYEMVESPGKNCHGWQF